MNMSGRARRSRALVGCGIVAAAVVIGGSGPAPAQVPDPVGPEIDYVDAYGPTVYGYEDCNGDVSTETDPTGAVFIELDDVVEEELAVSIAFTGSLADDLVDPPTEVVIPADDSFGVADLEIDEFETGDLTVTVLPGLGYVSDVDDTYTIEVTDDVEIVASCLEDLGTPPDSTDRQIIEVGEQPVPIGFFDEDEGGGGGPIEEPTTTETTETTETTSTTTTEPIELSAPLLAARGVRAVPDGYSTPVVNGSLPPGLSYADDEWTGAATTEGIYSFDIRLCFDQSSFETLGKPPATPAERAMGRRQVRAFPDTICFGYVDVQVAVLDLTPPPAAAPAASPVTAAARFAG